MKTFPIIAALFMMLLCGCSGPVDKLSPSTASTPAPTPYPRIQAEAPPSSFSGYVTSAKDGTPIAGATVHVAPLDGSIGADGQSSATTDRRGFYKFTKIQRGNYLVDFKAPLFNPLKNVPVLIQLADDVVQNESLTLAPVRGALKGRLTNARTGSTLQNALISIHSADRSSPVVRVATDAYGSYFSGALDPGSYSVDYSMSGYESIQAVQIQIFDSQTTYRDEALTPLISVGALAGVVKNADNGLGLSGVLVNVHPITNTSVVASAMTDSAGRYFIANLTPGSYSVDYSHSGFISVTGVALQIFDSQTTTNNETLTKELAVGQYRAVMTWCGPNTPGAVKDMDSYLQVPGATSYRPIGFSNKNSDGASLDVDNQNWSGPETITIWTQYPGTYIYYVNNFSSRSDRYALGNSQVKVSLYHGNMLIKSYSIGPQFGLGITFEVFHLNGDQVTDVMQFNDSLRTY